jgi:hypothetical protein
LASLGFISDKDGELDSIKNISPFVIISLANARSKEIHG